MGQRFITVESVLTNMSHVDKYLWFWKVLEPQDLFEYCLMTVKFGRHCRRGTGLRRRLPITQYVASVMYEIWIRLVVFLLPTIHCKLHHILIATSTTLLFWSWQISIIYTNVHRCTHQWGSWKWLTYTFNNNGFLQFCTYHYCLVPPQHSCQDSRFTFHSGFVSVNFPPTRQACC